MQPIWFRHAEGWVNLALVTDISDDGVDELHLYFSIGNGDSTMAPDERDHMIEIDGADAERLRAYLDRVSIDALVPA
jgi:malonyl CoA-acyl carrier protein transacylase